MAQPNKSKTYENKKAKGLDNHLALPFLYKLFASEVFE